MTIAAIVAVAKNGVIGKDGEIPWHLPADLKYFKRTTLHHPIIMGRSTFESIGRPLPKRTNIVLSRNPFFTATGIRVAHDLAEALDMAREEEADACFIIGGAGVYAASQHLWGKLYYTEVDISPEGDTYFPDWNRDNWQEVGCEAHAPDARNDYAYTFKVYERRDTAAE